MWTQEVFIAREAHDKLARYYQEVNRAKMLSHISLRGCLAQMLRGWAERLEPTPLQTRVDTSPAKSAH